MRWLQFNDFAYANESNHSTKSGLLDISARSKAIVGQSTPLFRSRESTIRAAEGGIEAEPDGVAAAPDGVGVPAGGGMPEVPAEAGAAVAEEEDPAVPVSEVAGAPDEVALSAGAGRARRFGAKCWRNFSSHHLMISLHESGVRLSRASLGLFDRKVSGAVLPVHALFLLAEHTSSSNLLREAGDAFAQAVSIFVVSRARLVGARYRAILGQDVRYTRVSDCVQQSALSETSHCELLFAVRAVDQNVLETSQVRQLRELLADALVARSIASVLLLLRQCLSWGVDFLLLLGLVCKRILKKCIQIRNKPIGNSTGPNPMGAARASSARDSSGIV